MSFKDMTTLGSVVKCFDHKRIPMSTRERRSKQGQYPYYGAAGIIDHVNKPLFSGLYLLMGEDGSVIKEDGTPVLQLVSGEFWVNNHAHVLQGETDLDTRFLYYALGNTHIQGFVTGAVQPKLNQANMNRIPVYFPEKSTRERIVEILSALDDKIELNRQTNATLEAIAQAIFKEWFVDFNYPGATGELVDGELGPIPKGWRAGKLNEIFSVQIGGDWGKDSRSPGAIQAISLRGTDIDSLKFSGAAPKAPVRWIRESSIEKRKIENTDVLIGGSGLGPIGKSIYCDEHLHDIFDYPITYSNFCKRLSAPSPSEAVFGEIILENLYKSGEMRQYFTGTSIPNLDIDSLLGHKLVIPSRVVLEEYFEVISKHKFHHIFNNESKLLSQMRDSLIVRLMNDEVRI